MKETPNHVVQRQERRQDREELPQNSEAPAPPKRKRTRMRNQKHIDLAAIRNVNCEPNDEECLHTPWLEGMPEKEYPSVEKRLHDEIVAYVNYMEPTQEETYARQRVFLAISRVIKQLFYDAEVNVYGSSATGLCLPDGDLDILVVTQRCKKVKQSLFTLASMLKREGLTIEVQVNHFARVPIVSFMTLPDCGNFSVDIGINNTDGLSSRTLVSNYLSQMPALRPLILVVKGFLRHRKLHNAARGGMGSYAAIMACISFLQLNPSARPPSYLTHPMESTSLGTLLSDFFFYYGTQFPYADSYISVAHNGLLPKSTAQWLPEAERTSQKGHEWRLVVQCPLHPENDVSKSIGKPSMECLLASFQQASAHILRLSPGDKNVLGPIVSVNSTTIKHRRHIREIVEYGFIDRLLGGPHFQQQGGYRPQPQFQHQYPAASSSFASSSSSSHPNSMHPLPPFSLPPQRPSVPTKLSNWPPLPPPTLPHPPAQWISPHAQRGGSTFVERENRGRKPGPGRRVTRGMVAAAEGGQGSGEKEKGRWKGKEKEEEEEEKEEEKEEGEISSTGEEAGGSLNPPRKDGGPPRLVVPPLNNKALKAIDAALAPKKRSKRRKTKKQLKDEDGNNPRDAQKHERKSGGQNGVQEKGGSRVQEEGGGDAKMEVDTVLPEARGSKERIESGRPALGEGTAPPSSQRIPRGNWEREKRRERLEENLVMYALTQGDGAVPMPVPRWGVSKVPAVARGEEEKAGDAEMAVDGRG